MHVLVLVTLVVGATAYHTLVLSFCSRSSRSRYTLQLGLYTGGSMLNA